jgi:effector-binding domain-containing protein
MKRWVIIPVLLFIILITSFIPITRSVNLEINAPYFNVYRYIAAAENWIKWQPDLKICASRRELKIDSTKTGFRITAPEITFSIENAGLNNFAVIKKEKGKEYSYNYLLVPQPKTNKTSIIAVHKTNIIGYIWSVVRGNDLEASPITNLKNYMEDTRLYYGFMIKKESTSGKLLAVKKGSFLAKDAYRQSNLLLNQLNNFVSEKDIKVVYPLQLQYVSRRNDSVGILLGLPVNKKTNVSDNIEYMVLPKGKVLVGYFKGAYKEREKLYAALQSYMNDNYIREMILPYERFSNDKLPSGDSTIVDMQIVIPYM